MTRKQIKEMVNNMKKSEIINKKSEEFHEKEEMKAEELLKQLNDK